MQFALDTEHCEEMKLTITDKERQDGTATVIQEFCFGMASLFVDFAMKLNCRDAKQADKLKEVCFSCIGHNIDEMVKQGLLEPKDNEIDEDEINDLVEQLKKANFSEDQIAHILEIVRSAGSIEAATDYLQSVLEKALEEKNIKPDENSTENVTVNGKPKDESGSEDAKIEKDTLSEKRMEDFDYEITDSGTLTITGTGAIPAQDDPKAYPWNGEWADRVIISEGITTLPYGALRFPEAELVRLPDSLTTIEAGAFDAMSSLKRLRFGKNVTKIDSDFFADMYGDFDGEEAFSEIIVSEDNHVYKSDDGILYSKDMRVLVRFPAAKKVQGAYAVRNGVEKIAPYAFSLVGEGLKEIILPSSVKEIGKGVFDRSYIERVDLSTTKITEVPEDAFGSCYNLENISLPDSIKVINNYAFSYSGIKGIILPEGVERIGIYAFNNSQLATISLPSTIKSIGQNAFSDIDDGEGYYSDELTVIGNMAEGYDHEKVTIEEDGNDLLLDALYDVPDIKGQIHFWEVKFCYGTGAGFTDWAKFNISCNEEEFELLQTLSSKQKEQNIDKVEGLRALVERIENKIENTIRDENDENYADWVLNDDGVIRYRVKGFTESDM